jgi:DNA-directed RNA polymerase specialized sigma24 family protein
MHRERLARVHRAMRELTAMQRSCLNLRAEGFLNREIAEILGIGMSSVADALRRAIHRLAKDRHE